MKIKKWYLLSGHDILEHFRVDVQKGLSEKQVKASHVKYGKNVLPKKEGISKIKLFFLQFHNVLIYILLFSAGISFLLDHAVDGYIILAAVLVNILVGYIQEYKAQNALEKLQNVITQYCVVLRDGNAQKIAVEELVPGDIVELSAGVNIPADCRLLEVNDLEVNEAALTGESVPVSKNLELLSRETDLADQKNMVFMGTIVTRGSGIGIVVETGIETEIGTIAHLIQVTEDGDTPLQIQLSTFSKNIGIAIVFLSLFIFLIGILLGRDWVEMFIIAIATAVSAVPEGLVIAVTVILAIGMERILKKKALVRKLVSAETLGSTDIVCSDKTGTLTEGDMKTVRVITLDNEISKENFGKTKIGDDIEKVLTIGLLCNDVSVENPNDSIEEWKVIGAPTERALFLAGVEAGFDQKELFKTFPVIDENPFNSTRKYRISLHDVGEARELFVSGAPERILEKASHVLSDKDGVVALTDEYKKVLLKQHDEYSHQGLRILGVGFKQVGLGVEEIKEDMVEDITFAGFYIIKDPVRDGVKDTINTALGAGIRTVMITGDHKNTARSIASELGLPVKKDDAVIDGKELGTLSDAVLRKRINTISVYARVSPKDKLRIVSAFQSQGHTVAMTGDGVNDAPALKVADIGIAVGAGTDVTKGVADMVLLDNNFKTIIAAISEGRIIVDNMKKIIVYLLADSFTAMVLIVGSLFLGLPLPVTAAQVLWINFITDSFPYIALTLEKGEPDIMKIKPRKKDAPILDKEMKALIFIIGIITDVILIALFATYYNLTDDLFHARTIIFAALGIATLIYAFSCRSLRQPIWKTGVFGNKYLIYAVLIGFSLQLCALYVPFLRDILGLDRIGWFDWVIILLLSMVKITGN